MVLHNQYPWDRADVRLTAIGELRDDDVVVLFQPRNPDVLRFVRKVKAATASGERHRAARSPTLSTEQTVEAKQPIRPYPAVDVGQQLRDQAQDRGAGRRQGRDTSAPTTISSATRPTAGHR